MCIRTCSNGKEARENKQKCKNFLKNLLTSGQILVYLSEASVYAILGKGGEKV